MVLCTLLVACGGDLGTSTPEPAPPAYLAADGVKVTRLSLYQGLERDLMSDGAVGSLGANIPTIAGRDALLRVYYATDAAYDGGIVLARVTLTDTPPVEAGSGGGMPTGDAQPIEKTIEVTGTLWVASSHDDLGSTLNVDIPGALLTPTSSFRVDILRARDPGPVLGVIEPGARAAIKATRRGRIGVIGTEATIASGAYARALRDLEPDVEIFTRACPLFVPLAAGETFEVGQRFKCKVRVVRDLLVVEDLERF